MNNKSTIWAALLAAGAVASGTARAETTPVGKYFVEGLVGASFADFNDFNFHNPAGTAFTDSPISGDRIILDNVDDSDTSVGADAAVGIQINKLLAMKLSYHYFGDVEASGDAQFGGPVRQDLDVTAHGLMAGLSASWDLTPQIFVELQGELGMGFMSAEGQQGANMPPASDFPDGDDTNFIAGFGGGVGYRLSPKMELVVRASYYDLGESETDTTGNPPPAFMNTNERLESDLATVTVGAGLRYRF